MKFYKIIKTILNTLVIASLLFSTSKIAAQHRGDNLSFQGLNYKDNPSAKAAAMGGAMTAVYGDLSSLAYNIAGLARLEKLQISVNVGQYDRQWRENQNYYPDRQFTTLPFYLEGLYIPRPENNGRWDYELYKDTLNYMYNLPKLGLDPYDEEAAQWKRTNSHSGLRNISIAYPFFVGERKIVVAASYLRNNINDYDRNDTYLSPQIVSYDYESDFKRVVNGVDTLNLKWSRYLRERSGSMTNIIGGVSSEIFQNVMLGIGVNIQNGESDDYMSLSRYGDIHLINQQSFKFYFVNQSKIVSGTSKYSSTAFNLSAMIELSKIKLGLKIDLPYTLSREWSYTTAQSGAETNSTLASSGTDEIKMPAIYNFGVSFQPVDRFLISFNYEYAPYSKAEFDFASADTTFRKWVDQNTLGFGMEYKMFDFLSLMAGYRVVPEVFIPDGAAIKDSGPASNSYNLGFSVSTGLGRIDFAYEYRRMKYYDSYYSNANYNFEANSTLMVGYTYSF
jgi:long-subunit fatty acid transport protein